MAIVQISRITQRKGLEEDLPQPLAPAELGWAVDARRLYIGPGTLAEGAPDEHNNVEILTEYSDLLGPNTTYTYQGAAAGYTVQTGPSGGSPVSQSLQSRLDSYAIVTDFGATGDGVTDDTAAINRALYQLFCVQNNVQIRRSLFFPAGNYRITNSIKVPPFCLLYGEGPDSSILNFSVAVWTSTVAYESGTLVKNGATYYRSTGAVPVGTLITDTVYWTVSALPDYVVQTANSAQQTGANIPLATEPQSIEILNMKIQTGEIMDGLLIEDAHDCAITNVNIQGPLTTADLDTAADDVAAVRWASTAGLVCNHITLNNCKFSGFTYGTNTDQQLQSCTISNSKFDTLYQGVYLGGASPVNGGATGTRLVNNMFDNIYVQGIVFDNVSLNNTNDNIFYDVGNHFLGTTYPASAVIDINTENNVCLGDMFQRTNAYSGTYPRIDLHSTASIATENGEQIQMGTYYRQAGTSTTLVNNTAAAATITTLDATVVRAVRIDYTITRLTTTRTGYFTIVASTDGTGGNLVYNDEGYQNTSTGVTLTATETGSVVSWKYTTTNTGSDATLYYSVTLLA